MLWPISSSHVGHSYIESHLDPSCISLKGFDFPAKVHASPHAWEGDSSNLSCSIGSRTGVQWVNLAQRRQLQDGVVFFKLNRPYRGLWLFNTFWPLREQHKDGTI